MLLEVEVAWVPSWCHRIHWVDVLDVLVSEVVKVVMWSKLARQGHEVGVVRLLGPRLLQRVMVLPPGVVASLGQQ